MDGDPGEPCLSAAPDGPAGRRFLRALIGVVAASAFVYPLLLCAVQLGVAQLLAVDGPAIGLWLALATACSVACVAIVRWGAARRVGSPWLLTGLAPPALYELWLGWPLVAS